MSDVAHKHMTIKTTGGADLPVSFYWNKKVLETFESKPTAPIPTYIEAYGSYGNTHASEFSMAELFWVKNIRGMYVFVHVRGGGEKGEVWHHDGAFPNRQNSIDDVISAAQFVQ